MLNIADFIFMGFVALMAVIGSSRGLVRSLLGLGSIVLSLFLAFTLYPMVSDTLARSTVGTVVTEKVEAMFGQNPQGTEQIQELDPATNEKIESIPAVLQETAQNAGTQIKKSVAEQVCSAAMNLISMLLVFLLVRLLIWLISKTLDLVTKLPVIHGCNKILGGLFGVISSVLIVYLLLGLLTFTSLLNTTGDFGRTVQNSLLVSQMYENNILLYFLQGN